MEIHAALQSLHLTSPNPLSMAQFYCQTYGMTLHTIATSSTGDVGYRCSAPGRQLAVSSGPANQLHHAEYALDGLPAWEAFLARTASLERQALPTTFSENAVAVCFKDPDENHLVFSGPSDPSGAALDAIDHVDLLPAAVLQHFALRTPNLSAMLDFYTGQLGFVLSDAVRDAEGTLRACFLRSNNLHHALALFFAPISCFDHQSYEATDWSCMKTWGDHMAAIQVPIVWGIGRHGPGNDVFFMVRDPDGNLAEISSEIEHCESGRPAGVWPHEERTLNLWGKAILRS